MFKKGGAAKGLLFCLGFAVLMAPFLVSGQACNTNQIEVRVEIMPDAYPNETSWDVRAVNGQIVAQGTFAGDTFCLPQNGCFAFSVYDSYGDGMCCAFGNGGYQIFVNNGLVASGGSFGSREYHWFNCGPGLGCSNALTAVTDTFSQMGTRWYSFKPDSVGMYEISTCFPSNTCATEISVFDVCDPLILNGGAAGALFYSNLSPSCSTLAAVGAVLDSSETYLIRIKATAGCAVDWSLIYNGPVSGCTDPLACNYNPLATVSTGLCLYYPDTLCPPGPDLVLVQSDFENSLYVDSIMADNCAVTEKCLTGYGMRTILRFDTHIENNGATDYFIGNPANQPGQFNNVNCHGHDHYEGYAEYVLYKPGGGSLPIGFKNGFCVLDLVCNHGGTAKYGCGNMGITAGCGDIYGAGLDCQWIDITDVPDGDYILANKVNWDQSPDALGRYESDYLNNWAQVCITLSTNALGQRSFVKDPNCPIYTDCAGIPYGNTLPDCMGVCGGPAVQGDVDGSQDLDISDYFAYESGLVAEALSWSNCLELSGDSLLTVWDLALLQECLVHAGQASACNFGQALSNPNQSAEFRILPPNMSSGKAVLQMRNATADVAGVELKISGLVISSILPVAPNLAQMRFAIHPNGHLLGLCPSGYSVGKSNTWVDLAEIAFVGINDSLACIDTVIEAVNSSFERIVAVKDPWCSALPLSNGQFDLADGLLLYPNPATSQLRLTSRVEPIRWRLMELNGRVLLKMDAYLNHHQIDLVALPEGVYLIQAENKDQKLSTLRFILMR